MSICIITGHCYEPFLEANLKTRKPSKAYKCIRCGKIKPKTKKEKEKCLHQR